MGNPHAAGEVLLPVQAALRRLFLAALLLPASAVLGTESLKFTVVGIDPQVADAYSDHFVTLLGRDRRLSLTTQKDISQVLGLERQRELLGCTDGKVSCLAELAGALGVDAIFCANDASAAGALETIRASGLRVPDDVALAGFDDVGFAANLDPPLTPVRQALRQHGMEAARALLQLLGDPGRAPRRVLMPTELVIRQSSVGGVPHE